MNFRREISTHEEEACTNYNTNENTFVRLKVLSKTKPTLACPGNAHSFTNSKGLYQIPSTS